MPCPRVLSQVLCTFLYFSAYKVENPGTDFQMRNLGTGWPNNLTEVNSNLPLWDLHFMFITFVSVYSLFVFSINALLSHLRHAWKALQRALSFSLVSCSLGLFFGFTFLEVFLVIHLPPPLWSLNTLCVFCGIYYTVSLLLLGSLLLSSDYLGAETIFHLLSPEPDT